MDENTAIGTIKWISLNKCSKVHFIYPCEFMRYFHENRQLKND